jgi:hypothetical protein
MLTVPTEASPPSHENLVTDLIQLRAAGLPRVRRLRLPALKAAEELALDSGDQSADGIEQVLRKAVAKLEGGPQGEATAILFGLEGGTRGLEEAERRRRAAESFNRSFSTFRQRYELPLVDDLATQVLVLCQEGRLRFAREQLERRHPAESRLAVQWVERFDAYYRVWIPIYALGADLTAYRSTLLEVGRPYDRAAGTDGPDDPGYTQEDQARGYARHALFDYALFLWELKQFMIRYGGHWMLSSGEAETAIADLVYKVSWHPTCYNERDKSWLRVAVSESGTELHPFLTILTSTDIGRATDLEWQEWVTDCLCEWDIGASQEESEYFPTSRRHEGVKADCQVHEPIAACGGYCDSIDLEWGTIADWYHLDTKPDHGLSGEQLYGQIRDRTRSRTRANRPGGRTRESPPEIPRRI